MRNLCVRFVVLSKPSLRPIPYFIINKVNSYITTTAHSIITNPKLCPILLKITGISRLYSKKKITNGV